MKPLSKITIKIAILLIASFISSICSAQSPYGEIRGKVTDAKAKSILDYATIVVRQDGIVKASTSSDDNGDYVIKYLPAGEYTLEVTYIGYTKYITSGIVVKSEAITFWNCQLSINNHTVFIDDGDFCRLPYLN